MKLHLAMGFLGATQAPASTGCKGYHAITVSLLDTLFRSHSTQNAITAYGTLETLPPRGENHGMNLNINSEGASYLICVKDM